MTQPPITVHQSGGAALADDCLPAHRKVVVVFSGGLNPPDDLSGMYVAHQGLNLDRMLRSHGVRQHLELGSLAPVPMRKQPLADFLRRARVIDAVWSRRVAGSQGRGVALRYRNIVTTKALHVGVIAVDASSHLGVLRAHGGTDRRFSFTTTRYRSNPLVITGPCAGAGVTAAGMFTDVPRLGEQRQ